MLQDGKYREFKRCAVLIAQVAERAAVDPRTVVKHFTVRPGKGTVGRRIGAAVDAIAASPAPDEDRVTVSGGEPDLGALRRLGALKEVDPRTLAKVLRGEPVKGLARRRALSALDEAGVDLVQVASRR